MHGAWFTPGSPFPGKWGWRSRDWSAVVHLPPLVCFPPFPCVRLFHHKITTVAKNTNTTCELEPSPTSCLWQPGLWLLPSLTSLFVMRF